MIISTIRSFLILALLFIAACGGSGSAPQPPSSNNNKAPVVVNDAYSIDSDSILDVLVNDSDPDGDSLTIVSVTQPSNGSVSINSDQTLQFTIDQTFTGQLQFTYTVEDSNGLTTTASVSINVNPAAKQPEAVNDRVTGTENVVLVINVLNNDSDVNGDVLSVTAVGTPANGTASIQNGTEIQYIPDPGFVGQDSFTYTISDGTFTNTASITLIINAAAGTGNQPPAGTADTFAVLFETTTALDVLNNDSDPENDQLSIVEILAPDHGTTSVVSISSNGQIVDAIEYTPDANYFGLDSLIYIVSDGIQSVAVPVNIEVRTVASNQAPLAKDDSAFTNPNIAVSISPFLNDFDLDGDILELVNISIPKNGNYFRDKQGTPADFTDDVIIYTPFPGFVGTDVIVYTLSDGLAEDRAAINFTVASSSPTTSLVTGSVHKGAVTGSLVNLYQVDRNGNPLPGNAVVSATSEADGSWQVEIPDQYSLLLAKAQGGSFIDEADPDINATTKRIIKLNEDPILESIYESGDTHVSITAYTSALVRKSRIESSNSFAVTIENNRGFTFNAFGFDPFSVKPTDPSNPAADASVDELRYALMLGGFSYALNANGSKLNIALPTTQLINGLIDDLSDCDLDAKLFGSNIMIGAQTMIDVTDINPEIRRFKNNNYTLYPDTAAQISIGNCQQSGVATDITQPIISVNGNNPLLIEVGDTFVDPGATASDNDDGDLSAQIESTANVNTSIVGSYAVNYEVWDRSGNQTTLTRVVNVVDTTVPVLSLQGNAVITLELGSTYVDAGATATDNYDGVLTNNIVVANNLDLTSTGNYTFTYSVSDSSGNNAVQLVRQVNVVDTTPPDLALLGSNPQTVFALDPYTEFGALALDINDGDLSGAVVIDASAVNVNAVGSYTVTYNVIDSAGNAAPQQTRTVNVIDVTEPIINLLGLAIVDIEIASIYVEAGATAMDQVDGDVSAFIVIDDTALNVNQLGSYQITYNVVDMSGNNAAEQIRRVNVVDTTLPVIALSGADPQIHEAGSPYVELGASATDNVDGDISADIVIDTTALDINSVGTYPIRYNVSDNSGNAATEIVRSVIVQDTTPPSITLLGSNPQTIVALSPYSELGATAFDTNDGDISAAIVIDKSNLNTNVAGTYFVTYSVSDSQGNSAVVQTRTVEVVDSTLPVITVLGANPLDFEAGTLYVDAGATAYDSVDGDLTASLSIINNVNTAALGTYAVTYDVTDTSGNTATQQTRAVNIVDTIAPSLSLNGSASITLEAGTAYSEAGASATDSFEGDLTAFIALTGSVNINVPAVYTLNYTVADSSGNTTSVTRTVTVVDTTRPVITLIGSNSVTVQIGTVYTDAQATASDNLDGDITSALFIDTSNVNTSIAGTYSVKFDVSDSAGNAAIQVTRTVNVVETSLTLAVSIINDNGGTAVSTDFIPSVDGVNTTWSTPVKLSPGAHNASQSMLLGYTASVWGGDCAGDGSITLTLGQNAICSVTNNDQLATYTMQKTASPTVINAPGNVTYTYLFSNTGPLTLTNLTVADSGTLMNCPVLTLAPTNSAICTSTYFVSQAEIDSGVAIVHTAIPSANSADGVTAVAEDDTANDNSTTVTITQTPSASVSSTPSAGSVSAAGTVITYNYVVNNTGNVTLNGLSISDSLAGTGSCASTTIAVGANTTCSASYTVTQADMDAGTALTNTVTASSTEAADATSSSSVTITQTPSASVSSTPSAGSVSAAGTVITYNYVVNNTGNVTLNGLSISDSLAGTGSCASTTIAVGANTTCSASYTVTQADMDAGTALTNTVTASSTEAADATSSSSVTITQTPSASVSSTPSAGSVSAAGTVITYNYVVNNTGNVTLNGLSISDSLAGTGSCASTTIAVGANTTCSASYTVTQADMDAGTALTNTVTASSTEAADATSSSSVTITQTPSASVSSTPSAGSVSAAGTVITYNYVVNNTGNVTLNGLSISDSLAGTGSCASTTIAVGANTTCSASYTVTQADMDAGTALTNTVTASSTEAADATSSSSVTITQTPSASVSSTPSAGSVSAAGTVITYNYVVNNTGNVTLNGLSISDSLAGTGSCASTTIAVGANTTCSASYTVTQADMDAGTALTNTVTASSTEAADATSSSSVSITQSPAYTNSGLAILSNDADSSGNVTPGDELTYTFTVTNSGNVTLTGIQIVDNLSNAGTINCPVIAPGATCLLTGTYTVDILDVNPVTLTIDNTGTATHGVLPPSPDTVSTPVFFADPNDFDSDGLSNSQEIALVASGNPAYACLSITNPDSDSDALSDRLEVSLGIPPCTALSDPSLIVDIPPLAGLPDLSTLTPSPDPLEPLIIFLEPETYSEVFNLNIDCDDVVYVGSIADPFDPANPGQLPSLDAEGRPTTIIDESGSSSLIDNCTNLRFENMVFENGDGTGSGDQGGAMRLVNGSQVYMDNVWLENNSASDQGGAITISTASTELIANNIVVRENSVTGNVKGGGGIWVGNNAILNLDNSRIYNNTTANHGGGGIQLDLGSFSTITNSVIADNKANGIKGGGGILAADVGGGPEVNSIITNNIISGNWSSSNGGGLAFIDDGNNVELVNNLIIANYAQTGAGVYINGDPLLANNTVVYNQSFNSGAAVTVAGGSPTVRDSIFWKNRFADATLGSPTQSGDTYDIATTPYVYSFYNIMSSPEGNAINNDLSGIDPQFESAFYLLAASPGINSGSENANDNPTVTFIEKTSKVNGQLDDDAAFGGDGIVLNRGYHYTSAQVGAADSILVKKPAGNQVTQLSSSEEVVFTPQIAGIDLGDGQQVFVQISAATAPLSLSRPTDLQPVGPDSVMATNIGAGEYLVVVDTSLAASGNSFDLSFVVNGTIVSTEAFTIIP